MGNVFTYGSSGIDALLARAVTLRSDAGKIEQRATSTIARRLPVQAARIASDDVLTADKAAIRQSVRATTGGPAGARYVKLTGDARRIPLEQFESASYGGPDTAGATAKPYRDAPTRTYNRTFAIKGRGITGGIFQRAPYKKSSTLLEDRLPIVKRKGPSVARALSDNDKAIDALKEFSRDILRAEIARLLKYKE